MEKIKFLTNIEESAEITDDYEEKRMLENKIMISR
jgi:hypothetical protein